MHSQGHLCYSPALQIIIGEMAAVAVGFEPVVEVNLIQIGRNNFFTKFMRFDAQKWDAEPRQRGDQGLRDLIRACRAVFVARFHLAQRGGDDQEAVDREDRVRWLASVAGVGRQVTLRVEREGKLFDQKVTLGQLPDRPQRRGRGVP